MNIKQCYVFLQILAVPPHPLQCCNIRDKSGGHMGSNLYVGWVGGWVLGGGDGVSASKK